MSLALADPDLYLGTVVRVDAFSLVVNLPFASAASMTRVGGRRGLGGVVGDHVSVDVGAQVLIGRLDEVWLPERDRSTVEPHLEDRTPERQPHPLGRVRVLATVSPADGHVRQGIATYPRLGAQVYLAMGATIESVVSDADGELHLGSQPRADGHALRVAADGLLQRHCAILGATGGGKSWTMARVLESVAAGGAKCLLIDATGEYADLQSSVRHAYLPPNLDASGATEITIPFGDLRTADLFALFTPSGQSQGPILREAVIDLRLAHCLEQAKEPLELLDDGLIKKANGDRRAYQKARRKHAAKAEAGHGVAFDASRLRQQVQHECVHPAPYSKDPKDLDPMRFGDRDKQALSYVVSMVLRIDALLDDQRFSALDPSPTPGGTSFADEVSAFLDSDAQVLRLDVSGLPSERNFKQLIVNVLVGHLLTAARSGDLKESPIVLAIDEAHHFLGAVPALDQYGFKLDALETVAKEGRKYGLFLLIATQRPRDLTADVTSQIGTVVVHRMTDEKDLEVLRGAGASADLDALRSVSGLATGEALVFGVGFTFPVVVKVAAPAGPPRSTAPSVYGGTSPRETPSDVETVDS